MTEQEKARLTRTMQIIAFALTTGVLIFAGVVLTTRQGEQGDDGLSDIFLIIALGMSVMAIAAQFFVSGFVLKSSLSELRQLDEEQQERKLWQLFSTKTIISLAIPEGASFFCLVSFMFSGNITFLFFVAGLLLIMIMGFPTRHRIENWVEARMADLQLEQ